MTDDKWMTICLECFEVVHGRQYSCPRCYDDKVKQQNIGYLFPENLKAHGIKVPEYPEICPDEPECIEESPEQARIKNEGIK